jgi:Xaa-Pro aminopeptidase
MAKKESKKEAKKIAKNLPKPTVKPPSVEKEIKKNPSSGKGNAARKYPSIVDLRLNQLKYAMDEYKVQAAYISYLPNVRYLTNFSGSFAEVIVHGDNIHFFTDYRYERQIQEELYDLPGLKIHITSNIWEYCRKTKIFNEFVTLGFEADKIPYSIAIDIRNKIRPVKFKPAPYLFEPFTQPKGIEELDFIRKACEIAEETYNEVLKIIKVKMSEDELANEIGYISRRLGSEHIPTQVQVTSGERGNIINGKPTDRRLKKNELLMINFSTQYKGFQAEISRTIAIGKATKQQKEMYDVLYEAQEVAMKAVLPGMSGLHYDAIVREFMKSKGCNDYFKHGLGYGIGLSSKEHPYINFANETDLIPEKSVIMVAPGVYTEKFGMRLQDPFIVTSQGGVRLTTPPKELPTIEG